MTIPYYLLRHFQKISIGWELGRGWKRKVRYIILEIREYTSRTLWF